MPRRDSIPQLPMRPDYGGGVYRRRIRLEAFAGRVVGELQDDFHHFAVDLRHDGRAVTEARGGALRIPWTTCSGSVPPLRSLQGLPVGASLREAARHTDPKLQCTHLFDLAALAARHAGRPRRGDRQYDVSVPDRRAGAARASLALDGEPLLAWELDANRILSPALFSGRSIADRDFGVFAEALGGDLAEAAAVLRRAVFISIGRRYDFEAMARADEFGAVVGGACHTFSPAWLEGALRVRGTVRDFGSDASAIFCGGLSAPARSFLGRARPDAGA